MGLGEGKVWDAGTGVLQCRGTLPTFASFLPTPNPTQPLQVHFPAALLDQLVSQLAAAGAALAAEQQQVADLLQRVRGAALAQTDIIQQLYAH